MLSSQLVSKYKKSPAFVFLLQQKKTKMCVHIKRLRTAKRTLHEISLIDSICKLGEYLNTSPLVRDE